MVIRRFGWWFSLLTLAVTTVFGSGCATNGRRVLLKEYGPSIPTLTNVDLKGVTVCIEPFTCATNLVSLDLKTKPEEPAHFKYMDRTRDQDKQWAADLKQAQKNAKKGDGIEIGNLRNGFGMVMSHVYALNDPANWLVEGLKYDLESQGAKVVPPSEAASADVRLSGTLQLCRTDIYMVISGDMAVDLTVQPKQGSARQLQIHTHGGTAAAMASEGEYFHALRDCREKFSIITCHEIARAMKP